MSNSQTTVAPAAVAAAATAAAIAVPVHATPVSSASSPAASTESGAVSSTSVSDRHSNESTASSSSSSSSSNSTTTRATTPPSRPTSALSATEHLVHSEDFCRSHVAGYVALDTAPTCVLRLPGRDGGERYVLSVLSEPTGHAPVLDVLGAMRMLTLERQDAFGGDDFQEALDRGYRRNDAKRGKSDVQHVVELVQRFNTFFDEVQANGTVKLRSAAPMQSTLAAHLWRQSYERVVDNPESLNRYQSFSREVYGETLFPLVNDILRQVNLSKKSLFVDLGMGIGNVVFQVAAQAQCNVYGIELLDKPFEYAQALLQELQARSLSYGRKIGATILRKGDFLQHDELVVLMPDVDVIFCQNYAFDAQTNNGLINLFLTMKNGAKIISFKPFAPIRTRLTEHSINDPTSIFRVTKHTYTRPDGVSWMTTPIDYFMHVIDRDQYKKASEELLRNSPSPVSPSPVSPSASPERSAKRFKGDDS